ncbi:hypothetical protein CC1G_13617 [Coprinopsis cinerea okayama7|uniref:Uncharacterized protein n=1 Tax=Coprinopsis cinerea (strain Okayama-7 / 130 / ATCC MYA-4618 / FGSC 9003) TaxID=240176 RepID=D6RJX2_COPC7|nr:hypothetical protein CC1G_13617 [Coprinopsis cinerea okayama7\|eukprot:XP_002912084.1 hypothetical protein CC1G_13617 [Coprinopsis cinerea okayama7\
MSRIDHRRNAERILQLSALPSLFARQRSQFMKLRGVGWRTMGGRTYQAGWSEGHG